MNFSMRLAMAGFGLAAMFGVSGANAATVWQIHHPRRVEVNARLDRQQHRITAERREGELTYAQAQDLRAQDRGIRAEERFDASRDGSHITGAERAQLNRQENVVSGEIGR